MAHIFVWVSMGDHCINSGWLFRNFKFGGWPVTRDTHCGSAPESNIAWTIGLDVAMVDAVLRSNIGRILRRSRICMKQERERWAMWSEKLRFWSKIRPKLRTGEFGVNVWVDAESRLREIDGSGIFFNYSRRPMSINSVFEGSRQRRFPLHYSEHHCLKFGCHG